MSVSAQMRGMVLYRHQKAQSPTTGQSRPQNTVAIPIRASIAQQSKADMAANDRSYILGTYVLTTYYIDVRVGDEILDGAERYSVEYVDLPRTRGPRTSQLERIETK